MFKIFFYYFSVFSIFSLLAFGSDQHRFFETKIRPLLHQNCFKCHGPKKQKAGLRLDHISFIKEGSEHGQIIDIEYPLKSKLLSAIQYTNPDLQMPPPKAGGKLGQNEINILKQWVLNGLYWPEEKAPQMANFTPGKISQNDREWWAFQPFDETKLPTIKSKRATNAIDLFIEEKLTQNQIKPAPAADKRELIRRVVFDLHGLPPTPEQVQEFLNNKSEDAYEQLVDQLLNSPRYGERWAQHWLDVVRYSESDGYRGDHFRPHAYQYRDYVVDAFNSDKPYDQFVREQLAGDELDPGNRKALTATMYLRHWIYEWNQRDVMMQWDIIMNDITETTADAFMGMSVACARCHNHKFDPIMQKDYYRLQAYFKAIRPREDMPVADLKTRKIYESKMKKWKESTAELRYQIHDIEHPILLKHAKGQGFSKFVDEIQSMMLKHPDKRSGYETQIAEMALRQLKIDRKASGNFLIEQKPTLDKLYAKLKTYDHLKPKKLPTMKFLVSDTGKQAPVTTIPDSHDKNDILPGPLYIFDPKPASLPKIDPALNTTGRRTALANWITKKDNPLTARVMVNRIWQRHFGKGIVRTPNNFGRLGEMPTHPELLNWLAQQFVDGGWKIKHLHKFIMTSATYQQTARVTPTEAIKNNDPQNHLLWRYPPLRLDAEQIRDTVLSMSGQLDTRQLGGASVKGDQNRRSIYVKKYRNTPDLMLNRFNAPEGFKSMPSRNITNTPLQSLLLFNSKWPLEQAKKMAHKIEQKKLSLKEKVNRIFQLAYSREVTEHELQSSLAFIREQIKNHPKQGEKLAIVDLCHVIMNSNEFLYLH